MAAIPQRLADSKDGAAAFLELAGRILSGDAQVFLVYDAGQALQLRQHLGSTAAVVDLDADGAHGLLDIRELRERNPDLPVIAVSSVLGVP
ncbi:MAG TPA: hypothetical protein VHW09_06545 [Bryobacteraceae bacterium]|jgi:CheY-like chemotaxis protein|nr:hypothetical protein [Bryobacteraceae bacterium]